MKTPFYIQIFFSLLLLSVIPLQAQTLNQIVDSFIKSNEVHSKRIGVGQKSVIYQNYERLSEIASTEELLNLTRHVHPVVQTYAGWALIDKSFSELPELMVYYLEKDLNVNTFTADIKDINKVSSEFYHRYWSNINPSLRAQESVLFRMDSIILYHPHSSWLLILRALENRIYPKSFHPQIEYLAFEKLDKNALFYLSNWYKADYRNKLQKSFTDYLQFTNFKNVGVSEYYRVVNELLSFNQESLQKIVVEKLRKDKFWEHDRKRFTDLLDDYSIYELDLK